MSALNSEIAVSVEASIAYLASEEACTSIRANPYWPKWNSPWWHMSLLYELGMTDRIPKTSAEALLAEIKRTHLPLFFRHELPLEKSEDQDTPCPCALGNIYQTLHATGIEVDSALPWVRGWFLKYQMPDGGMNCDEDAYNGEANASSIVATVASLEAILYTTGPRNPGEEIFLERGIECLLNRELRLGSLSDVNSEERLDEDDWLKPCYPRFYFYDVLRGLRLVLKWALTVGKPIPLRTISKALGVLGAKFPDGKIRIERDALDGVTTVSPVAGPRPLASRFLLLEENNVVGNVSPSLTRQWTEVSSMLIELERRGLFTSAL